MHAYYKSARVTIGAGANTVVTDDLHETPFKNLNVWVRPADSTTTYSYKVDYGGQTQASGSVLGGKVQTYNDTQIQPPNQASSNWSQQGSQNDPFAVGLPINLTITNTGSFSAVFLVSFTSETFNQVTG
jgi:hypothetical protein